MRWENVHVAGVGVWLAGRTATAEAVAEGLYDAEEQSATQLTAVCAARAGGDDDISAPEMAVRAAQVALHRAGAVADDISTVFHSHLWYQGADLWPAASFVAGHTVGADVPALELLQQCNGGLAGVEMAARALGEADAALLTTADRFAAPGFDRWRAERGLVYGDGGTALVLSTRAGFARLRSTATTADNGLEGLARPGGPGAGPPDDRGPVDLDARSAAFFSSGRGDFRDVVLRTARASQASIDRALSDAGVGRDDVARVVLNATGLPRLAWQLEHQLGIDLKFSNWEFCREVGHLGAGDHFAGLNELVETGEVGVGDLVLLVGGGTGYTCTSAVLEITGEQGWL
ncbi:ketoacyl-ACP synthase III family protein [Peterkaempfera sp. SMS 1(5)a]|uniref:ketoacyl-ACP synthase III family protein n=1 Tax=Peterkaempfera podocarpi TaxID=3232308 RepID=UPI003672A005